MHIANFSLSLELMQSVRLRQFGYHVIAVTQMLIIFLGWLLRFGIRSPLVNFPFMAQENPNKSYQQCERCKIAKYSASDFTGI